MEMAPKEMARTAESALMESDLMESDLIKIDLRQLDPRQLSPTETAAVQRSPEHWRQIAVLCQRVDPARWNYIGSGETRTGQRINDLRRGCLQAISGHIARIERTSSPIL